MMQRTSLLLVLALVLGLAAGCSTSENGNDQLSVVVTTNILGDVVGDLAGEDARVEILIEGGTDPHEFSPSASQAAKINSADLVVANGLDLEAGLIDLLDAALAEGTQVLYLAERLDPLPFAAHADEDDDHADEDDDHADLDPHFWLDPLRMADGVVLIAEALSDLQPEAAWDERAADLRQELEHLHTELETKLEEVPAERRKLVTNHHSLGYFADRYGFEVVSTVIPGGSTMGEPSASDLAELVDTLEREDIRAIFTETTSPSTLADAVAAELGDSVRIYDLYTGSLGEPGSGADTYAGMMRTNVDTIVEALTR
jgi:zinc/manganese transport system substrate-binding protein